MILLDAKIPFKYNVKWLQFYVWGVNESPIYKLYVDDI
jgi:hypothetical protein